MTTVEGDLNEYGIYQITNDDPNLYAFRDYYVSSNKFSNKQFQQGIIDLLLLKGEEYSTHWESQSYRNLFIICSTFKTLE